MLLSPTDTLLWIKMVTIKDTHGRGNCAVIIQLTDAGHINPEHIYSVLHAPRLSVHKEKKKKHLHFNLWQMRNFTREWVVNSEENTKFTMCFVLFKTSPHTLALMTWVDTYHPGPASWSLQSSCMGLFLSFPGNQLAPASIWPLHMLSLPPQALFHSFISLKKCPERPKHVTGAEDMLINEARPCGTDKSLYSGPSSCLFPPSGLLFLQISDQSPLPPELSPNLLNRPILPIVFIYSLIQQINYWVPKVCCTPFLALETEQWK